MTNKKLLKNNFSFERKQIGSKGGRKTKLQSWDIALIEDIQDEHSEYTLRQIQMEFHSRALHMNRTLNGHFCEQEISTQMISKVLKRSNFTTKKLERESTARNSQDVKEVRRDYCIGMSHVNSDDLIFIDEKPWNLHQIRSRGRSRKGLPALTLVRPSKGINVSFIAAISIKFGLIYYELLITGNTGTTYANFLQNLFKHAILQAKSFYIVQDNAKIHMTDEVDAVFQANNVKHTRIQLPPYSPLLNPIELMFSKFAWKIYEIKPMTTERLMKAVEELASDGNFVTVQDCQHWMDHAKGYYFDCVAMKDLKSI